LPLRPITSTVSPFFWAFRRGEKPFHRPVTKGTPMPAASLPRQVFFGFFHHGVGLRRQDGWRGCRHARIPRSPEEPNTSRSDPNRPGRRSRHRRKSRPGVRGKHRVGHQGRSRPSHRTDLPPAALTSISTSFAGPRQRAPLDRRRDRGRVVPPSRGGARSAPRRLAGRPSGFVGSWTSGIFRNSHVTFFHEGQELPLSGRLS